LRTCRFLILKMNNEPLHDMRGLISRLPDVPVASNFTARVLHAVELEELGQSRWRFFHGQWRFFLPRAAAAATVVGFAAVMFQQHELSAQRQELAEHAAFVAESQPMPSVDALKNFDPIQRMSQTARPDDELLSLASYMK
jgi:hypothetical protein